MSVGWGAVGFVGMGWVDLTVRALVLQVVFLGLI